LRFRFRISPRAGRQIRAAARWWLTNRTAAPTLLSDEIGSAYILLGDLPFAGEEVPHSPIPGLRRVLLGRTHYHLYYVVSEADSVIDVLALWHTSRGSKPRLS
jgi:plasmid stabilization system protein ParE